MFYMHRGCVTVSRVWVQGQGAGVALHTNCQTHHPEDTLPPLDKFAEPRKTFHKFTYEKFKIPHCLALHSEY